MEDQPDSSPSLLGRVRAALARSSERRATNPRVAVAVGVLLALAPLLTWGGARWQEARVRGEIPALSRTAGPRIANEAARESARAELAPLLTRPTLAATLDGLARALPPEANVVRAELTREGRLTVEVSVPDPDKLRAAMRRDPATRRLRDAGQRAGDAAMLVTFEGAL